MNFRIFINSKMFARVERDVPKCFVWQPRACMVARRGEDDTATIALHITPPLGPDPMALVQQVVQAIAAHFQWTLTQQPHPSSLEAYSWSACPLPLSDTPSGSIHLSLPTFHEAEKLQAFAQGRSLRIGHHVAVLTVDSPKFVGSTAQQTTGPR